jgi:hypothetical protein
VAHSAARSGVEGVGLELARARIGRGDDEGTLGAGQGALKRRAVLEVPSDKLDPVRHGLPGAGEDTDFLPTIAQARDVAPDVLGTPDHDDHATILIRRSVAEDEQDLAAAPIMLGAAQGVGVLLKAEG